MRRPTTIRLVLPLMASCALAGGLLATGRHGTTPKPPAATRTVADLGMVHAVTLASGDRRDTTVSVGGVHALRVVVIGTTTYLRLPAAARPPGIRGWLRADLSRLAAPELAAATAALDRVPSLEAGDVVAGRTVTDVARDGDRTRVTFAGGAVLTAVQVPDTGSPPITAPAEWTDAAPS